MRVLLIVLALLFPAMVLAQEVTVRSGEHAGFSRLVLGFDASAGWQLGRIDGGWEFRAEGSRVSFDVSRVYDLIPRTRIAAVETPAPGVLRLRIDCACHVDGFELRRSRVVIDVKDGPAPPGNPFETPLDAASTTPPAEDQARTEADPREAVVPADLANAIAEAAGAPSGQLPPADGPAAIDLSRDADLAARSREFEARILDELARAGGQGLIVPADVRPSPVPAVEETEGPPGEVRPDAAPLPDADPAPRPAADAKDNLRVETAVDRDAKGAVPEGEGLTDLGGTCPAPRRVDLATWGLLTPGASEIGQYRADLTGEFDEVDPENAMRLARFYVFLTFGAEALQSLALVPDSHPDRKIVAAMAEILDHEGTSPAGAALDGYETCDSAVALWSVLAGPALRPGQEVNENAVVRGFAALPDHVKLLLGPRLVEAFVAADRLEAGQVLRNDMLLATEQKTKGAALASARLDTAADRLAEAEKTLGEALGEIDPDDPNLLADLAEARLRRGEALDRATFELLESLVFELRGRPEANRIESVLAEAMIVAGEFRQARTWIDERLASRGDPAAPALLRGLYLAASERSADAGFLQLVLLQPEGLGHDAADAPARFAIARRLLDLGFGDDALAVLGAEAQGRDPDARLIAGRAHLSLGRPEGALAVLAALGGQEAAGLMAEAQEALGNHVEARRLFGLAGRDADAERMAIREGDWLSLAASDDPLLRALAGRLADAATPPGPGAEPYDAARKLIKGAASDRDAVGGYLSPRPLD